jgi:hypothetical protein
MVQRDWRVWIAFRKSSTNQFGTFLLFHVNPNLLEIKTRIAIVSMTRSGIRAPLREGSARTVRRWLCCSVIAVALIMNVTAEAVELEWVPEMSHDVEARVADAALSIRTTGTDPYLIWRLPGPVQPQERVLELEYFAFENIESVSGYHGPPITETSRFSMPDITTSQGWQSYRVDLVDAIGQPLPETTRLLRIDPGTRANVTLRLRNVRLRERTPDEVSLAARAAARRRQKLLQHERMLQYRRASFDWTIRRVRVDADQVQLSGDGVPQADGQGLLRLVEYLPHHAITDAAIDTGLRIDSGDGQFELQLPRHWQGRDRLHSGWRLQAVDGEGEDRFVSARHFATTIAPRWDDRPAERAKPDSQKGLSAVSRRGPLEELPKLGIRAITINLVLNRFLSTQPDPQRERLPGEGPALYFDPAPFSHYDDLLEFARQHDIVVTAIVLIPRGDPSQPRFPLVHPESDGGVYAMPDLSSDRGAQLYGWLLDRIARRYRHPARAPGGITNWVAHNEIDFHPVWTNMGPQPRAVLTETYYRSMRMIGNAARQHNPHARVFVSLTHHWVVPDDGKWRQLSPKEMIESLQRYSELEGDFPWGVAYHPYPQSLFASVPWNDRQAISDFDTPLITIQNLEILGEFLSQPSMLDSQGHMRPVLLSEQGFHTESYEPRSQSLQAGALWYAMRKIRDLPWIESFHYHRWIDHPNEGGLRLGLRTLPDATDRYGKRKLSWEVYQAIGTAREQSVVETLPQPPGEPSR